MASGGYAGQARLHARSRCSATSASQRLTALRPPVQRASNASAFERWSRSTRLQSWPARLKSQRWRDFTRVAVPLKAHHQHHDAIERDATDHSRSHAHPNAYMAHPEATVHARPNPWTAAAPQTGSNGGLEGPPPHELLRQGCATVIARARNVDSLAELENGGSIRPTAHRPEGRRSFVDAIATTGGLDIPRE